MSSSLYWCPVPKPDPERTLDFDLKKKIAPRLWGHDGSIHGNKVEVGPAMVPYLEGLADCGVDGAADLIAAIHAHGAVELWIGG